MRTTAATPILPKIPAALSRLGVPNGFAQALSDESDAWTHYCNGMPEYDASKSPYANMPPGGREIQQMAALPLTSYPNPFDGSDQVVLRFACPIGYDGIIGRVVNFFTGTGFIEGSGNLIWRVKVGNKYARNLGNVTFTYGSLQEPFTIPGVGVPIVSGQTLTYIVNIPALSPIGGQNPQVICGIFGWLYPRK